MHIVYTVLCTQHFREFRNEFSVSLIYENIKIIKILQINLFIISQSGNRSKVFAYLLLHALRIIYDWYDWHLILLLQN